MQDIKKEEVVEKKKHIKLRFTIEDDLNLLKEALNNNPYSDKKKWKDVYVNFMKVARKDFSFRAVKDHVEYLINLYSKESRINLRKSGSEEYGEREQLLDELKFLRAKFKTIEKNKNGTQSEIEVRNFSNASMEQSEADGEDLASTDESEIAVEWEMENSNDPLHGKEEEDKPNLDTSYVPPPSSSSLPQQKKHGVKRTISELLKDKHEKERELEHRRMDIEEKKIELERKRIALKEAKFQQQCKLQEQQHQLITMLLQQLTKKD